MTQPIQSTTRAGVGANNPASDGGAIQEAAMERLAKLREPFPAHQISKLPKPTKQQTEIVKADFKKGHRCAQCGSWHHPDVVHLDYVGHAALTDRLLDCDPQWSWEPAAFRDGLPAFDSNGGLWIRLTVCGVTRLGYGHAANKPGADPGAREKEVIGDALRNAAMRFGAALDLWHKGDLHVSDSAEGEAQEAARPSSDLTERAARVDGALRNAPDEAALEKAWGLASELCAKLSTEAPDKLDLLTRLYEARKADLTQSTPFDEAA